MTVTAELSADDPSRIVIDAPFRYKDLIKQLPGSRFSKGEWRVPLSWPMCIALRTTFKTDLTIGPGLAEWAGEWRKERIEPGYNLRNALDADGYEFLYPFQRAGVKFLSATRRAILADGLGSGKTYTSFGTIKQLNEDGKEVLPLLIVCPNSTKIAWQRAVESMAPELKVTVVSGTSVARKKQFKEFIGSTCEIHEPVEEPEGTKPKARKKKEPVCTCPRDVLIINWEALKSHSRIAPYGSNAIKKCIECGGVDPSIKEAACQAHERELNTIDFKAVIGDEAHRIKSGSALTTRALKAATGGAEYRFALTGTPIANAPDDLWSILNWLYPDAFPSKVKYIDRYLDVAYNVWGSPTVIGVRQGMEKEFFACIDPILRRMPKEVVLPHLPPVVYERRDVEMSPKQKKAYEQMRDQMLANIDGELLINTSPMTKILRLLQLSTSYMEVETREVVDEKTGEPKIVQDVTLVDPSSTLDAFMDDLEGFGDESIIVFAPSKQIINMLSKRLDKAGISHGRITGDEDSMERQFHMDNFQSGKVQFILCTTGAGGTGITLTRASMAVYLGRPWSSVESEQSEGRNHRLGSEIHEKIIYRDYVARGTVQEVVFQALTMKNIRLQEILRDKELLKKVLEDGNLD